VTFKRRHTPEIDRAAERAERLRKMMEAQAASSQLAQRGVIVRADVTQPPAARPVKPKAERWESVPWRRAVASLPCVLCGREGDTQAAHRNEGKGMALKTDDSLTAALCTGCHTEIDQGAHLTREQRRERMDRAILLTVQALARAGRLRTVEPA